MSMMSEAPLAPGMLAFLGTHSSDQIPEGDGHIVSIALKRMTVVVRVSHPTDQDGRIIFGVAQPNAVTLPPADKHHAQHETIHLHVQDRLLAECFDELRRKSPPPLDQDAAADGAASVNDPVVEHVGRALRAHDEGDALQGPSAGATCLAIVLRLLTLRSNTLPTPVRPQRTALPKWRLKRAFDFVEEHLAEPVTLAEIAAYAGLSRMYFAAQFRSATGLRPHEYLLRRRIERAQELLTTSCLTLVEVALSVGFQTQAHFTTVFKRFAGETPHQWRRQHRQVL
ncbi:MAG TPA: AraC family transcriptional regulator [Xanthobacteraceae bacterium]